MRFRFRVIVYTVLFTIQVSPLQSALWCIICSAKILRPPHSLLLKTGRFILGQQNTEKWRNWVFQVSGCVGSRGLTCMISPKPLVKPSLTTDRPRVPPGSCEPWESWWVHGTWAICISLVNPVTRWWGGMILLQAARRTSREVAQ